MFSHTLSTPSAPPPLRGWLTLQCSQRFLIELSTFIPRTCCRTAATAATGALFGRPTPAARELHTLGAAGDDVVEHSAARVGSIVGRRERESARRLVVRPDSELLARTQRATHAWLAMFCRQRGGWGVGNSFIEVPFPVVGGLVMMDFGWNSTCRPPPNGTLRYGSTAGRLRQG